MLELLKKKQELEVLKLRTRAKWYVSDDDDNSIRLELDSIEANILNVEADILEATPVTEPISMDSIMDKFPEDFGSLFREPN